MTIKVPIRVKEVFTLSCLIILSLSNLFPHHTNAFHDGHGKEDRNIYVQTNLGHLSDDDAEVIGKDVVPLDSHSKDHTENLEAHVDNNFSPSTESNSLDINEINTTDLSTSSPQESTESSPDKTSSISVKATSAKLTKDPTPKITTPLPPTTKKAEASPVQSVTSPLPPTTSESPGTTLKSSPSTSTSAPTTTTAIPPTKKPKIPADHLYCLCDLHRNTCDMNCCCDADCNEEDRAMFSKCDENVGLHDTKSVPRRQRSCYQSFVFFKNYETYNLERTDNGLLCILRDNNKEDNVLPHEKIEEVRNRISKGKISIQDKYGWGKGRLLQYEKKPYYFGSPILLGVQELKNSSEDFFNKLVAFGLPSAYHDSSCTVQEPVLFLENFYSHCRVQFTNLTKSCETMSLLDVNLFTQNQPIVRNPNDTDLDAIEISTIKSCKNGLCTSESELSELGTVSIRSPALNKEKTLCEDVIVKLNLTVLHFGPDGISEIIAKADLQDIPLNATNVLQEYRVNFQWVSDPYDNNTSSNDTEETRYDWPRSGNPGYLVGKPVIMGEKVKVRETLRNNTKSKDNNGKEEELEDMILVFEDPSRWLTIQNPGICSENPEQDKRKSVLFDYGHSSTCSLNLTRFKYCEDLQIDIAKVLFGTSDPLDFDKRPWHVAAYGNSNPEEPSEWIPLEFENFPIASIPKGSSKTLVSNGCEGIVVSMHITIYYVFVGSVEFPQARITRVVYGLGDSIPIATNLKNDQCTQDQRDCQSYEVSSTDVSVTTTVSFKDITGPPIVIIPRWPIVSIRLPADFFYPFSSPSLSGCNTPLVLLIIINAVCVAFV